MFGYNTHRTSDDSDGYLARYRNRPRPRVTERDRSTMLGHGNRRYRRYNYHNGPRRWGHWWHRYNPDRLVTPSSRSEDLVPPPEDMARIPNVKNVDLMIQQNTTKHKTDEYECTKPPEDRVDGKLAELVVRRGEYMRIRINFDRTYDKFKHDMKIKFTFGPDPLEGEGTEAEMVLNEEGKKQFRPDQWGARLVQAQGKDIIVDIHIACNCIIGEWNLSIVTTLEDQDYVKDYTYTHGQDIIIIFNPWCKEDTAFVPSDIMRLEYVLEDTGIVYQGQQHTIIPKDWTFGQFEMGILDCTLRLITRACKERKYGILADPIRVARILANKINEHVLLGKWSGDYGDGIEPWTWGGSVKILQEHWRTERKVKYGQCWVFSGLLCTVCRALGIPCRSITNYGSAHDTDDSNTIDKYFYWHGQTLKLDKQKTRDSIWNFHVWNEVHFTRPDLDPDHGSYDGWQVVDATPQELSDGIYTCGPASLVAIKHGLCDRKFDTGFVFSEVNSDEIHWERRGPKYHVFKKMKKKIGNNISTKQCGRSGRDDVTDLYKYKEGSAEERQAVKNALMTAENRRAGVLEFNDTKRVKFNLLHSNDVMIGEDLLIEIRATNNGHYDRNVVETELSVEPELYTGESNPHDQPIAEVRTGGFRIEPGRAVTCMQYTLKARDYLPRLIENAFVNITMSATVAGTRDEQEEHHVKEHHFVFKKPQLTIEMPNTVRFRRPVNVILSFYNPLPYPLTNMVLSEDTVAFMTRGERGTDKMRLPDVPAKREFKMGIDVLPTRVKRRAAITFTISSRELYDIRGSKHVEISK